MAKRILIVEDNENNMYLISFILKKGGYEIIQAWNGEEGVELAKKERPDLIVMDIMLPGIDGYEATKRIRETDDAKEIPVVALTSYAMVGDREKAFAAGCAGYIEKPLDPEKILEEIEKYLK
ncbi:MAG: response regulator [Thermodesulfovibrionales bacterium]|nr:response regulator [Thermodesulfovibrionales bacterium]